MAIARVDSGSQRQQIEHRHGGWPAAARATFAFAMLGFPRRA